MKIVSLLTTCLFCVQFLFANSVNLNKDQSPIIFILDASGSMWGQVEGKAKIEIARDVLDELVANFETDRPTGLVAYGHRQKGDCQDVEFLVDPESGTPASVQEKLKALKPLGKTPLAHSASLVIDKLKSQSKASTVILLTDGIETCEGDLCQVVADAKKAGIDFVMHIVGFDLGDNDRMALECAAKEGEGLYLDASNSEELSDALNQATELSIENLEATLEVTCTKDQKLIDAVIKVYKAGDSEALASARSYDRPATNPVKFHLPAGNYDIKAELLGSTRRGVPPAVLSDVEVPADTITEKTIDFSPGMVSVKSTMNGEPWDATVNVYSVPEGTSFGGGRTYTGPNTNPLVRELEPGTYEVVLQALNIKGVSTSKKFENVLVVAGETVELAHNFELGQLSVQSTTNGALSDASVSIYSKDPRKSVDGGRTYTSASSNPSLYNLTPGVYDVELKVLVVKGPAITKKFEDVHVKANETTAIAHNFDAGTIKVGAKTGSELLDAVVSIYSINPSQSYGGGRTYTSESSNPKTFELTPGTYEVTVKPIKKEYETKKFTVTVEAGKTIEQIATY